MRFLRKEYYLCCNQNLKNMKLADLKNEKNLITPSELKHGEVAIIRKWGARNDYVIGAIVIRYKQAIIPIGYDDGKIFSTGAEITDRYFLLEVLPKGTLLEV